MVPRQHVDVLQRKLGMYPCELLSIYSTGSRLRACFLPPSVRRLHIKKVLSAQRNTKSTVMVCIFVVQSPAMISGVYVRLQIGTT